MKFESSHARLGAQLDMIPGSMLCPEMDCGAQHVFADLGNPFGGLQTAAPNVSISAGLAGSKAKHLAAHPWAVPQMHIPGMLRALARHKSRKMFVGNSRAAPFTSCQIWPEMMSFLITRGAYFCLSTDFMLPEALWSE